MKNNTRSSIIALLKKSGYPEEIIQEVLKLYGQHRTGYSRKPRNNTGIESTMKPSLNGDVVSKRAS